MVPTHYDGEGTREVRSTAGHIKLDPTLFFSDMVFLLPLSAMPTLLVDANVCYCL